MLLFHTMKPNCDDGDGDDYDDDHRHHYDDHDNDDDKIGMKFYHARSNNLTNCLFFLALSKVQNRFSVLRQQCKSFFLSGTVFIV